MKKPIKNFVVRHQGLSRVLGIIIGSFCHPFYAFVGYLTASKLGYDHFTATNVSQINITVYAFIMVLIFALRFIPIWLIYKLFNRNDLCLIVIFDKYLLNHLSTLPCGFVFWVLCLEVEGNIMGFIYFPIISFLSLIFGPLVFFFNMRLLYKIVR